MTRDEGPMFIVFGGDIYYPGGGWEDYLGTYQSREEAEERVRKFLIRKDGSVDGYAWAHYVDLSTGEALELTDKGWVAVKSWRHQW